MCVRVTAAGLAGLAASDVLSLSLSLSLSFSRHPLQLFHEAFSQAGKHNCSLHVLTLIRFLSVCRVGAVHSLSSELTVDAGLPCVAGPCFQTLGITQVEALTAVILTFPVAKTINA